MNSDKKRIFRDIVLIAVLLAVGIGLVFLPQAEGNTVEIRIDGELYGSYSLREERHVPIEKDGTILGTAVIENGCVYMENAACKGKDCQKTGRISSAGRCILCLPQGIGIYVVGENELDGVTG